MFLKDVIYQYNLWNIMRIILAKNKLKSSRTCVELLAPINGLRLKQIISLNSFKNLVHGGLKYLIKWSESNLFIVS